MISSHEHVSGEVKRSIEHEVAKNGILANRRKGGGWSGGELWLVPTRRDIADWQPVARRRL
jgi:2',3'-cyclic-nucleotide 3'-phosphodiesterase